MQTDLNKRVEAFFEKTSLENITIENINKFLGSKSGNGYGNLLHAAVYQKFDEQKVSKFIEALLANGVNVNERGRSTGYSFIHLALYGYTEGNTDRSYTTEFIVNLINIAKKYNLDIQISDNDGDSIVHTALASEVYTGSTIEILKALGNDFNVKCKDNDGNDIYSALLKYIKEAEKNKNNIWLKRLLSEKEELIQITNPEEIEQEKNETTVCDENPKTKEADKYSETKKSENDEKSNKEKDNYLSILKDDLVGLLKVIDKKYLLENYTKILEMINQTKKYLKTINLSKQDKLEFDNLISNFEKKLTEIFTDYIKTISNSPNYDKINELSKVIKAFSYSRGITLLNDIKREYDKYIESIRNLISSCCNFDELKSLIPKLEKLETDDLKTYKELRKCYDKQNEIIEKIFNLNIYIQSIEKWFKDNSIEIEPCQNNDDINQVSPEQMIEILNNRVEELKNKSKESLKNRMYDLLNNMFLLEQEKVFTEKELFEYINLIINSYYDESQHNVEKSNSKKVKVIQKGDPKNASK